MRLIFADNGEAWIRELRRHNCEHVVDRLVNPAFGAGRAARPTRPGAQLRVALRAAVHTMLAGS